MVHHNVGWRTLIWTILTKILNGNKRIHPQRRSIQTNHIRESWTIQPRHLVVAGDPKCHIDWTGVFSNLQSRKREDGKCNLNVILCTDLEKFCIFNLCCGMVTLVYGDPKLYFLIWSYFVSIILASFTFGLSWSSASAYKNNFCQIFSFSWLREFWWGFDFSPCRVYLLRPYEINFTFFQFGIENNWYVLWHWSYYYN